MGGIGSGRWPNSGRATVSAVPRIGIRELVRGSMPADGQAWLLSWQRGGVTQLVPFCLPHIATSRTRSGPIMVYGGGRTHERHAPAYHH